MQPYPKRIYLSGTWKGDARQLTVQLANLIAKYDVTVVRDDERNKHDPLKESRTWVQRVDYMLRDCSGLVVVFPLKVLNPQQTSPFLIPEILSADAQGIPILLFANSPLKVEPKLENGELVVRFPNATNTNILRFTDIAQLTPRQNDDLEALLNGAGGFALKNTKGLKRALDYPNDDHRDTEKAVQDFVENCPERKNYPFVFNILPFSLMDSVHQSIATEVFKETGMACHISLDEITDKTSERENWRETLGQSDVVIAELSSLRDTCLFETGYAIGLKKSVFVASKKGQQDLPFGLDDHKFRQYKSAEDLARYVRETCCKSRRREVFNLSEDFKALDKSASPARGLPHWLDKKSVFGADAQLTFSIWAIFLSLAFAVQALSSWISGSFPKPNVLAIFSAFAGFLAFTRVGREFWEKRIRNHEWWVWWTAGLAALVLLVLMLVVIVRQDHTSGTGASGTPQTTNAPRK